MNDSTFGLTSGVLIVIIVGFYAGVTALTLWVGYLLMRTAVKNGTLLAHDELDRRAAASERTSARVAAQNAADEIARSRKRTNDAIKRGPTQP